MSRITRLTLLIRGKNMIDSYVVICLSCLPVLLFINGEMVWTQSMIDEVFRRGARMWKEMNME
ncbi:MAG: hypothetical protein GF411_14650 [Candidatus Lokiarchaeota archaeon]|nr:hypothetical protein [Candidatus Lokiarchaeota archaeon]